MTNENTTQPGEAAQDWAKGRSLAWVWGIPLTLFATGFFWHSAVGPLWTLSLLWIGAACTANGLRCGRFHCTVMGPTYLVLGLLAGGNTIGLWQVPWSWIGNGAGVIAFIACAPECLGFKYWPGKAQQ